MKKVMFAMMTASMFFVACNGSTETVKILDSAEVAKMDTTDYTHCPTCRIEDSIKKAVDSASKANNNASKIK